MAFLKEDCPDIRNSKVFELVEHLESFNCEVDVFDPLVVLDNNDKDGRFPNIINEPQQSHYDAIILAVPLAVSEKGWQNSGCLVIMSFRFKSVCC